MSTYKSRFTEYLAVANALPFRRWVFEPGMLFLSESKWWGDKGSRDHRHSGLDLQFYENHDGRLQTITEGTKIPLIFEGRIVRIMEDFLGHTIFAAHETFNKNSQLFTIYGHVKPAKDILIDNFVSEGKVVASLAGTKNAKVPAHLHLSLAFIPTTIPFGNLTWQKLDESEDIMFLDPRDIIE